MSDARTNANEPGAIGSAYGRFADAIRAEQCKLIYRYLPPLLAINTLVASALAFALWGIVAHERLVSWLGAMFALVALRAVLYVAYRRRATVVPVRRWLRWFTFGSGASGAMWGIAGLVLFAPDSLANQLLILFVLVGMAAGGLSSLTAYMPAFHAYLPASMLPIGGMLLWQNEPIQIALGFMVIVYVGALLFFGQTINGALIESLSLRFANVDLVEQLSLQRDEAQRANIGKSKFLAAASHDLRQPLHALTLFTSALDEQIKYPNTRRIVDNINAAARALEKLFNALLDISRLDAGVLQPELRHFALDDLLSGLVNEYTPEADSKALELVFSRSELIVHSDPALLERIVRNYLSNAIRYTERGQVRVACVAQGNDVRIDVIDTGIGIPAAQHAAIFDEFHQLGNRERDRAKGLGLGLSIVQRVARLLGHRIEVKSEVGRGARFSVTVPLGDADRVAADERLRAGEAGWDLTGLCVVVVDDERSVREGMATLLAQWGCRVIAAASEEEAVVALRLAAARPEVIVADYRLRNDRTGVQAIKRFREEFGGDLPALIVTGDTAPERLRDASAGGHQLVHKPVQPALLRAFLRNARRRRIAV